MNDPLTLQELMLKAKQERGSSVRRLALAAAEHGFKVTHTTLNSIAAGTYKSTPGGDTLRAIAWLSSTRVEDVYEAAGLPAPGPPFADELPPGVDRLSPKARRAVINLLRVLVEQEAGEEHDQRSAPMNPAGESPAQDDALEGDVVELRRGRGTPSGIPLGAVADSAPSWRDEADERMDTP